MTTYRCPKCKSTENLRVYAEISAAVDPNETQEKQIERINMLGNVTLVEEDGAWCEACGWDNLVRDMEKVEP